MRTPGAELVDPRLLGARFLGSMLFGWRRPLAGGARRPVECGPSQAGYSARRPVRTKLLPACNHSAARRVRLSRGARKGLLPPLANSSPGRWLRPIAAKDRPKKPIA